MIAVELMSPYLMRRSAAAVERKREAAGALPAVEPAGLTAQFRPLDPGIVHDEIPAFYIGRNREGFWVARDANGKIGGIFLLEHSALSFARKNSEPAGCATIFPSERFELDLENSGNPLLERVGWLKRLARRGRQRTTALAGHWTGTLKLRLKALFAL
jgi:hypothetical protein